MGEPARFRLKVRFYEADEYGHVNHANYVHYLEVARIEALEVVGLPLREMRRQGYLHVAAELLLKYHSSAQTGDTLDIVTYIREMRGARCVWAHEIREVISQRLVMTAEGTAAFMTESGRPVRIPETFREKLSALYVPDARPARERTETGLVPTEKSRVVTPHRIANQHGPDRSPHRTRPWCVCRGRGLKGLVRQLLV